MRAKTLNVKAYLILCATLAVSGCSSFGTDRAIIDVFKKPVERIPLALADPTPLSMSSPQWLIVTPENVDKVWEELGADNKDIVVFGLTDDGYEKLAVNFAEMRNYISEQRQIIIQYKQYYEATAASDDSE